MTSKPADTIRALYAALGRGDVPAFLGLLDDEVVWTECEGFPYYTGTWHGPHAVLNGLVVRLVQDWDDFAVTADDFITEGDRVVSFGAYSGVYKATGKKMRAVFAHRWQVRDGKVTRFDMFTDTLMVDRALR
jgi:ketosteroid isomerase-like protein